jgi:hypothetical protein
MCDQTSFSGLFFIGITSLSFSVFLTLTGFAVASLEEPRVAPRVRHPQAHHIAVILNGRDGAVSWAARPQVLQKQPWRDEWMGGDRCRKMLFVGEKVR